MSRRTMTGPDVVGRDTELAALDRFIGAAHAGPGAIVLEGRAGVGKTTLWRVGLSAARNRRYRVLVARPSRSEAQLSFSGLSDLLEDVLDDALPDLPPPQRHALGVALLRIEASGTAPDMRTIATAVRTILATLARERPLVVAIDDLQWLDPPSASALAYAMRRLGGAPVALLASIRLERPAPLPSALDEDIPVRRIVLGPLSVGALHELLRDRLGTTFARPVLLSIHGVSGGNPLFAIELARAARRRDLEPGPVMPVAGELRELLRERIAALPGEFQEALAVLAAQARPTVDGADAAALDAAVAADILVIEGDDVRFVHPLLASVAYGLARPTRRRVIHAALAERTDDPEERARHLALATNAPSEQAAVELDQAAARAAARGAPYAAAELMEMAVRLTPAHLAAEHRQRRLTRARHLYRAGDPVAARAILEQLLAELPPGPERADVLVWLADTREDDLVAGLAFVEQALGEMGGDPARGARTHDCLGILLLLTGDLQRASAHFDAAVELAGRSGDRRLLAHVIGHAAHNESLLGRYTPGRLERGLRLEGEDGIQPDYGPTFAAGLRAMYADRLDESRRLLGAVRDAAVASGEEAAHSYALIHLAEIECRGSRLDAAERLAAEALERAEQAGMPHSEAAGIYIRAQIAALRGEVERTRRLAERGLELVHRRGVFYIQLESVLGFLQLSLGDARAAARHLRPLPPMLDRMGYGEPSVNRVLPNAIEALVMLGDLDEARRLVDQLEERGRTLDSPWSRATGARSRGLLLTALGDPARALVQFRRALAEHERLPETFERGRTLLALGATERRLRRQRLARESLEMAIDLFQSAGTPLWAQRARDELARIGGRLPQGQGILSETERRIAELVARGLSNKEIAAMLYVTVRTVEANLTRIYGKLGVRRRTELAGALSGPQPQP